MGHLIPQWAPHQPLKYTENLFATVSRLTFRVRRAGTCGLFDPPAFMTGGGVNIFGLRRLGQPPGLPEILTIAPDDLQAPLAHFNLFGFLLIREIRLRHLLQCLQQVLLIPVTDLYRCKNVGRDHRHEVHRKHLDLIDPLNRAFIHINTV